jgi:hypothetical protein
LEEEEGLERFVLGEEKGIAEVRESRIKARVMRHQPSLRML